ncbi:NUDIX hydrolase [Corynebacterium variabile]
MSTEIRVSAVAFLRHDGEHRTEVLTVRKRGTELFQFPGGKPEQGESPVDAAVREVHEETGVLLTVASLRPLGRYHAPAANEDGHTVVADVFTTVWTGGTPPPALRDRREPVGAPGHTGGHAG